MHNTKVEFVSRIHIAVIDHDGRLKGINMLGQSIEQLSPGLEYTLVLQEVIKPLYLNTILEVNIRTTYLNICFSSSLLTYSLQYT